MLLVQSERNALLASLTAVVGVVERRHTLPILSNLFAGKKGRQIDRAGNRSRITDQHPARREIGRRLRHHHCRTQVVRHRSALPMPPR